MADVVDRITRSKMMASIRGKNTQPEILIRKALHAKGYRYRIHNSGIKGKPDMVLPKYGAVIFINGCFWHQHDCHLFKWPQSRMDFWKQKISGNRERDIRNWKALNDGGWKVVVVWECALKGKTRLEPESLIKEVEKAVKSGECLQHIAGSK